MAMRNVKFDVENLKMFYHLLVTHMATVTGASNKDNQALLNKLSKEIKGIKRSTAKAKGLGLQMDVAQLLSEVSGCTFHQGEDDSEIFSRLSGQSGTDVGLRGMAKKLLPFSIECKNTETFSINAVIEQAKANEAEGTNWLIAHKNKGLTKPVYVMDTELFTKMLTPFVEQRRKQL